MTIWTNYEFRKNRSTRAKPLTKTSRYICLCRYVKYFSHLTQQQHVSHPYRSLLFIQTIMSHSQYIRHARLECTRVHRTHTNIHTYVYITYIRASVISLNATGVIYCDSIQICRTSSVYICGLITKYCSASVFACSNTFT